MTQYTSLIDTEHAYLAWFAEHFLIRVADTLGEEFVDALTLTIRPCMRVRGGYELVLTTKFFEVIDEPCYKLLTLTGSVANTRYTAMHAISNELQDYRIKRFITPLVAQTAEYKLAHHYIEFYRILSQMLWDLRLPAIAELSCKNISVLAEAYQVDISPRPTDLYACVTKMIELRRVAAELHISFKD